MITVENLVKRYAGVEAVRGLSFKVESGEIVGFLGPNGAGKSTTMRILSGFMPATSGEATVAGFDVFSQSIEVRKRIGYMPENVPLYTEMTVNEFLNYRAQLKGVKGRFVKDRVQAAKKLCDIVDVGGKIINTLSKGYRQRVGLADALTHDPELLILDEPTIGLDPNQIRQVRDLIKSLGKKHTILLSTHILPEVEMTCSRVMILNKGKIEVSDTPENLIRRLHSSGAVILETQAPEEDLKSSLKALPQVDDVHVSADGAWVRAEIFVQKGCDLREAVYNLCQNKKWLLRELTRQKGTLEDVFVELTHEEKI